MTLLMMELEGMLIWCTHSEDIDLDVHGKKQILIAFMLLN